MTETITVTSLSEAEELKKWQISSYQFCDSMSVGEDIADDEESLTKEQFENVLRTVSTTTSVPVVETT